MVDIADHLHLPPIKLHCSMLAEEAINGAINDFLNKTKGIDKDVIDK
jgi:nitrogen fixation NifU-like protein